MIHPIGGFFASKTHLSQRSFIAFRTHKPKNQSFQSCASLRLRNSHRASHVFHQACSPQIILPENRANSSTCRHQKQPKSWQLLDYGNSLDSCREKRQPPRPKNLRTNWSSDESRSSAGAPMAIIPRRALSNIAQRSAILKMLGSSWVTTTNVVPRSLRI